MFRKRKASSPSFRMPPPFHAISGNVASLRNPGLSPYCVLMQVAEDDIYANYCLCRGFDTRINKFIDYENGNPNKPGIPVAKPYGARRTGVYTQWEIHAALLPIQSSDSAGDTHSAVYRVPPSPTTAPIRIGQNPGKASVSEFHPQSISEEVEELFTEDDIAINWMFVGDTSTTRMLYGQLAADMLGPTPPATIAVDNLTDADTGAPFDNLTANNTFNEVGLNNDVVLLRWIWAVDNWVIIQVYKHWNECE